MTNHRVLDLSELTQVYITKTLVKGIKENTHIQNNGQCKDK